MPHFSALNSFFYLDAASSPLSDRAREEARRERVSGRRCAAGCGRFVGGDAVWCERHRISGIDGATGGTSATDGWEREPDRAEDAAARRRARQTFRRGLERGDYRGLLDRRLAEIVAGAATERGLADEIGALRFVLARLLAEEEDLTRLAAGVARIAGVAVRATRAERVISGEQADGLTSALAQILAELDGE